MKTCGKCGANMDDRANFCPSCGTKASPIGGQNEAQSNDFAQKAQEAIQDFTNTADFSSECDAKDIADNKVLSIFAYIGILFLVPLLAAPNSKFARFHTNQGLILFLGEIVCFTAVRILVRIFRWIFTPIGVILEIVQGLVWIVVLAFAIIGIVNAAQGKCKELPIIGSIRIIK